MDLTRSTGSFQRNIKWNQVPKQLNSADLSLLMCAVIVIMKMPVSIHSVSGFSLCCLVILAKMSLQCYLMTHGSCISMLHKTKPKRIRHQHLHFPLTNVTVKTDKDLNVEALFGVAK